MEWIIAVLAGAATGVLSGLGVGGGSLRLSICPKHRPC